MKNTINQINILSVVFLSLAFCFPTLQAAVITVEDAITGEWSGELSDRQWINEIYDLGLTQFDILGFDSSLGELTEIQFDLTTTVSGSTTFQNTTGNSGTFERDVGGSINVASLLSASAQTDTEILPVAPYETVTAIMGPVVGTAFVSRVDTAFLDLFIDPIGGTTSLDAYRFLNPGGTIYGDNGANFTGNIIDYSNIVTGTLSVSYIFNEAAAVPEPSALLLMATGLAGLGFAGRKKKQA